jgi:outer membrane protein assembly factor BamE (lipoprotein component of BamABCDE complex)
MEAIMVKYAVLALVIMCSGCEHDRSFHGNYITTDDIAKITVRKSSMNDVRAVLGTPFIMTKGNEWIYIYKEVDSVPFKENVIKTHKKCRISFTKDRNLTLLRLYSTGHSTNPLFSISRIP